MRIILVEDDITLLGELAAFFRAAGFTVDAYSHAEGALAALAVLCPRSLDAVVTDYHLGGRSGSEIVQAATNLRVPIVVVTGSADREAIARAVNLGARFVLIKPFAAQELVRMVREAAGERCTLWRAKQLARRLLSMLLFWGGFSACIALWALFLERLR